MLTRAGSHVRGKLFCINISVAWRLMHPQSPAACLMIQPRNCGLSECTLPCRRCKDRMPDSACKLEASTVRHCRELLPHLSSAQLMLSFKYQHDLQLTVEGWNGTKAQILHSSQFGASPWVRHLLLCTQHPVDN